MQIEVILANREYVEFTEIFGLLDKFIREGPEHAHVLISMAL